VPGTAGGSGSPATDQAAELVAGLVEAGVTDVVLSPGSRSQALALVLAEAERAGLVRLRVRVDERTAGFTALGLAVGSGRPAAVVTTSGTAVANLHPAVLEAHHSGVPLVLLTADRPVELRGIGANQTTHQPGLFGRAVAWWRDVDAPVAGDVDPGAVRALARDAAAAALGRGGRSADGVDDLPTVPGPVQLDLAYREPLSAPLAAFPAVDVHAAVVPSERTPRRTLTLEVDEEPATVVVAGHAAGPGAERLARRLGAPLVAEVSSGARFGPALVPSYRQVLQDPDLGGRVRRVVVLGHPTLSREVPALLRRPDVEVVVVQGDAPEAYDPSRSATVTDAVEVTDASGGDPTDRAHRAWTGRWVQAGRALVVDPDAAPDLDAATGDDPAARARVLRDEVDLLRRPVTRASLAASVWRATWPHDRLVLGASRLIREFDATVGGKAVPVHANRGLAGIDGTLATATGIALAAGRDAARGGTTRAVVGDLTALHDVGSMLLGEGEERPRLQLVVGDDGGGTIFDGLEVAATAPADAMRRVQTTPQRVDFSALAAAYGWRHVLVRSRSDLERALVAPGEGPVLVEVPLDAAPEAAAEPAPPVTSAGARPDVPPPGE